MPRRTILEKECFIEKKTKPDILHLIYLSSSICSCAILICHCFFVFNFIVSSHALPLFMYLIYKWSSFHGFTKYWSSVLNSCLWMWKMLSIFCFRWCQYCFMGMQRFQGKELYMNVFIYLICQLLPHMAPSMWLPTIRLFF